MNGEDYLVRINMLPAVIQWTFLILVWIVIATAVYAGLSSAPWVPTRKKVINQILKDLKIGSNDTIIDLGSGSGSTLLSIEKQYPNATYIGYEISLFPLLISILKKWAQGSRINIKYKSLYKANLKDADLIFIFLMPKVYKRLVQKFAKELKDDTRVLIEAWPLPNIDPEKVIRPEGDLPVYVYNGKMIRDTIK